MPMYDAYEDRLSEEVVAGDNNLVNVLHRRDMLVFHPCAPLLIYL